MSQAVLNMVAKKALKNAATQNINAHVSIFPWMIICLMCAFLTLLQDPYFEEIKIVDKRGNPTGEVKKQRKGIPVGVSTHDGKVLKSVRKRAYRLDRAVSICGFKFGWSSIIGFIPG